MTVTIARLRRLAVAQQNFQGRPRRASDDDVATVISRLSCVQLDPLTVVERTHRVVLSGRAGDYRRGAIGRLFGAGQIFEHWAHERCLLPIDAYPLLRKRMREPGRWQSHRRVLAEHPRLVEEVRGRIRVEGALPSRAFEGARDPNTLSKPATAVLDALWDAGELVIASRSGGERAFDLSERVIPRRWLDAPEPSESERLRALALRAVRARGVLSEAAIREHWRLKGGRSLLQPQLDALVAEGVLGELRPDDGGAPVYVPADADLDTEDAGATVLLSPFDNLLWDRDFTERLFGFRHLIETYKPAPRRVYGYYVLPFLWRDRIVARADLKADRKAGVLRLLALHVEPGVRRTASFEAAFERALARLARTVGVRPVAG
ncbi:MAG: winged helix-turn-helix domain-containing protein [Gaiellaceae bacterium]